MSKIQVRIDYKHDGARLPEILTLEGEEALVVVRGPQTAVGWTAVDKDDPDHLFVLLAAQLVREELLVEAIHRLLLHLTLHQISALSVFLLAGCADGVEETIGSLDSSERALLAQSMSIIQKELDKHDETDEG